MTDMEIDQIDVNEHHYVPTHDVKPSVGIDCHTLNLKDYISRYEGFTKLKRLQFIMDKVRNLKVDAYFTLMEECKKTVNTDAYVAFANMAPNILGSGFEVDQNWIDTVERKMTLKLEKLMNESSAARSSMINESIRLSYCDLGYHYYEVGNLHEAQRLLMRMRDYCTTARHNADMTFSILNILLDLGIFTSIPSYLSKSNTWANDPLTTSKTKVVMGIYELNEGRYKESARLFLSVDRELNSHFSTVIAPEDIALYGVILGLASLERTEFKRLVESKSFRNYLELVPGLQVLVSKYLSRSFNECLPYIEQMAAEWKLDIYLAYHVENIISQIKENLVVDYFTPYSALSLAKMSSSLNIPDDQLEMQLYKLIIAKKINAHIDDESRSLIHLSSNNRVATLQSAKKLSQSHVLNMKGGLMRLSIIKHKITLIGSESNPEGGVGKIDSFMKASMSNVVNFDNRYGGVDPRYGGGDNRFGGDRYYAHESEPRVLPINHDDDVMSMDDPEDND